MLYPAASYPYNSLHGSNVRPVVLCSVTLTLWSSVIWHWDESETLWAVTLINSTEKTKHKLCGFASNRNGCISCSWCEHLSDYFWQYNDSLARCVPSLCLSPHVTHPGEEDTFRIVGGFPTWAPTWMPVDVANLWSAPLLCHKTCFLAITVWKCGLRISLGFTRDRLSLFPPWYL